MLQYFININKGKRKNVKTQKRTHGKGKYQNTDNTKKEMKFNNLARNQKVSKMKDTQSITSVGETIRGKGME